MIQRPIILPLLERARSENLLLLFSLLIVCLPHLLRLPALLTLYCSLIIGWRFFYDINKAPYPGKVIRFLLMIIGIVAVLTSYKTIVGQYAGTALLVVMLCLKLTEFKSTRDAMVIVFLGFFVIITGFLFSQSIPMAAYMVLTAILLTTTLIAFQHKTSSQIQHLKFATQLLLYSVPLAIVLFILFPRITGPLWGLPSDAFSARTGMSDSMSPGSFNKLVKNNEVAFRVKFDSLIPEPAKRYWRGPVMWSFNGRTWGAPKHERIQTQFLRTQNTSLAIDYTITLEPHNQYWLFALDMPTTLPDNSKLTVEMQLISRSPVKQVTRYPMTSHSNYHLAFYDYLPPSRYLSIPDHISPRARDLVQRWQQQGLSKSQIVTAALDYFTDNEFYYSRKPPLLFSDPVDEFLFDTRKGYCEHYSSAFTVLMRLAGIPARIVTGYFGGEMNPVGDYMIIRQSDAHAWSEVYLEDKGWLRIDPTAVIPPYRIEADEDIVRIKPQSNQAITILKENSWIVQSFKGFRNALDSINNTWNQWVIGYNNKKQTSLFNAFGIPDITWAGLSTIMFSLLGVLLGIFSFYILRLRKKLDPVSKIYSRFCKKIAKRGLVKEDNETANNFAKRIVDKIPDKKLAILKITNTYNNLHYGKYQSQALIEAFSQQVDELKF